MKAGGAIACCPSSQDCANCCPGCAMQHAALGPPENIVRVEISLAVPHIRAVRHPKPEAVRHLARRDIAPPLGNVAFILALVEDQWLSEVGAPLGDIGEIIAMYADVGDPWLGRSQDVPVLN